MLKRISVRKILISSSALLVLFLIYLIPKNEDLKLNDLKQELSYVDTMSKNSEIFLLDTYSYVSMVEIPVNNTKTEAKVKELIEVLITGGIGEDRIPSGFKSIIPSETKIISIKFEKGLLKINFSKELLDINKELEEKMVESIIYTITSIEEIENVIIYVEGEILTKLPKSGVNLPSTLNRNFGINKQSDLTSINDISQVTVYFINKHNDNTYYVPVTKYLNDSREKVSIIIDELTSSPIYNSNLMSYLNGNTKLLNVEKIEDVINLNFNQHILNDINKKIILEEVIYTISLSVQDNYDISEIVFKVDNEQICKSVVKMLE